MTAVEVVAPIVFALGLICFGILLIMGTLFLVIAIIKELR